MMETTFYTLKGHEAVPFLGSVIEWGKIFERTDCVVDQTYIGDHFISTIFLGMNFSLFNDAPLLFETMVFCEDGKTSVAEHHTRYPTWDEAAIGHKRICEEITSLMN